MRGGQIERTDQKKVSPKDGVQFNSCDFKETGSLVFLQVGVEMKEWKQIGVLENSVVVKVAVPEIVEERQIVVVNIPQLETVDEDGLQEGDQKAELWSSKKIVDHEIVH